MNYVQNVLPRDLQTFHVWYVTYAWMHGFVSNDIPDGNVVAIPPTPSVGDLCMSIMPRMHTSVSHLIKF